MNAWPRLLFCRVPPLQLMCARFSLLILCFYLPHSSLNSLDGPWQMASHTARLSFSPCRRRCHLPHTTPALTHACLVPLLLIPYSLPLCMPSSHYFQPSMHSSILVITDPMRPVQRVEPALACLIALLFILQSMPCRWQAFHCARVTSCCLLHRWHTLRLVGISQTWRASHQRLVAVPAQTPWSVYGSL